MDFQYKNKNDWVHGILLPAIGNEQRIMKRHRLITPNLHLTQRHAACNSSGRRMSRVPWCGASGCRISLQLQNPNAELITNVCPVALVGYFKML